MSNALMIGLVVLALVIASVGIGRAFSRQMRPWILVGLAAYLSCEVAQMVYSEYLGGGGDALNYRRSSEWLASLMDRNFSLAAPEAFALLIQRPSMFDAFLYGGGTSNTGSMYGAGAWMTYLLQGSGYATCTLVTGLSYFGALGIYAACQRAATHIPPTRLFIAVVLFPSVPFWTATLHKEAFCLMGIGLIMTAWSGIRTRRVLRVVLAGPLGVYVVTLFRTPALAPVIGGLVIYFLVDKLQKTRGAEASILKPMYVALAMGVLVLGMVLLARVAPALALERISDTIADKQSKWANEVGGSQMAGLDQDAEARSLPQQLVRVPLALVNALFRPQLFDVRNGGMLISATEMTVVAWLVIRMLRNLGLRGLLRRIQSSPYLAMCAVVTVVGCLFVGLVTLNFGSLSRYRVPFLPFYGALLAGLLPVGKSSVIRARRQAAVAPRWRRLPS